MAEERLNELLEKMSQIAEAVNLFNSEAVQQSAFTVIMDLANFRGEAVHQPAAQVRRESDRDIPEEAASREKPARVRKSAPGNRAGWVFNKELNLRPSGSKSFEDFIAEKKPQTNEDRYAVVVYYLSEILERSAISIDDIGSVIRLTANWREPKDLYSGVRKAGSRRGTVDTSDRMDIRLTPHGRNFVEHDLPPKGSSE